jgi:hypothetical protein
MNYNTGFTYSRAMLIMDDISKEQKANPEKFNREMEIIQNTDPDILEEGSIYLDGIDWYLPLGENEIRDFFGDNS